MIITPRFALRPLTPDDATERYADWFNDEAAANHIVSASSAHDVADLRAYIEARAGREDVLFLGIFTRSGNEHIGNIKYEPLNLQEHYAVMGILVGEAAWRGRGVAGEVIAVSGMWLRNRLGIEEIILGVSHDHKAAIRAYEKIGFRPEPTDKIPPRSEGSLAMVWRLDGAQGPELRSHGHISDDQEDDTTRLGSVRSGKPPDNGIRRKRQ